MSNPERMVAVSEQENTELARTVLPEMLKSGIPACTFNQRHKFRRKGCSPMPKCRYCGAPAPRRIMLEIDREKASGEYWTG